MNPTEISRQYNDSFQARVLLRKLKREKLELWAVGTIRKFYYGWQVRKQYKSKFRKDAGPKISRFFITALVGVESVPVAYIDCLNIWLL